MRKRRLPSSYWRAIAEDTQVADRRVSVVADDGDQLVGMVGGDWDEQSGRVHLVALWVDPSSQGRGVGKALVAEVLSWARERPIERVELWVVDDALAAAAFYASCGFVGDRRPPDHPRIAGTDGEAACPSDVRSLLLRSVLVSRQFRSASVGSMRCCGGRAALIAERVWAPEDCRHVSGGP